MQAEALIGQMERKGGAREGVSAGGACVGFAFNRGRMGLEGAVAGCAIEATGIAGSATVKWGIAVVARSGATEWHGAS